jgi:hypothetical protein
VLTADASGNATWQAVSVTENDPQVGLTNADQWCRANAAGTAVDCNPITDGTLLSFASVNASGTTEGLILPQNTGTPTGATAEGQISWDSTNNKLYVGDGTNAVEIGAGGSGAFTNVSGVVRNTGIHASDDFVFGSPQLSDDGDANHDSRFFFDKSQSAFRAGAASSTHWDAGNVGQYSVGIGYNSIASGKSSVALGEHNIASDTGAVALGYYNEATGAYSVVPGGNLSEAVGEYSFAAGRRAKANHQGAFVWADSTALDFTSAAVDEFAVRATGGVRLVTAVDGTGNPTAGVTLAAGSGTWGTLSDRNAKENFESVDTGEILNALAGIPIETWNYKTQDDSIRHMGPMAQDFHTAFGMGKDNKTIATVDADGVALAAIQGLYDLVQEQKAQIEELRARIEALENK